MLNPAVGTVETIGERQRILTRTAISGHALYGPYLDVEPGRYVVLFDVALGEEMDAVDNRICAVIDVTADFGQRNIAFDRVLVADLSTQEKLELEFDVGEILHAVEFRVWTTGISALIVGDEPPLLIRQEDRPAINRLAHDQAEDNIDPQLVKRVWLAGVRLDVRENEIAVAADQFNEFRTQVLFESNRQRLAERVIETVGYRGCGENSLYRAFVGFERPLNKVPQPITLTSTLCNQTHFGYDQYRFWQHALKDSPKYQRKQWEFFFIAQVLYERDFLQPGRRGLVFGAGEEQLPALFASFGVEILATDQAPSEAVATGWARSKEHTYDVSALNQRGICIDRMFRQLVSFEAVDMNDIPESLYEKFDFCWSACALEHIGSLEHGLSFIENAMKTLIPGGLAVHTTEFNLSSNKDTLETEGLSIYRRRDIENLLERLQRLGYEMSPVNWDLGEGFAETVVDLAPFQARGEPHIRLRIGQYDCTSIGIIIHRPNNNQ